MMQTVGSSTSKRLSKSLVIGTAFTFLSLVLLFLFFTPYQIGVLILRGGAFWVDVTITDPRLTDSMRLAIQNSLVASSGPVTWKVVPNGFETTELPVLVGDRQVDTISLARFDPKNFKFIVRNDYLGLKDLKAWMKEPNVVAVINGSYYGTDGKPDTPIVSEMDVAGPQVYDAKSGAFLSKNGAATIEDLAAQDWKPLFAGADNAMVSYPLLVANGENRVTIRSNWLANRSFVAVDNKDRIVIGSTKDAFFSLFRLGEFLKVAPLDLTIALNMDGGPLACLGFRSSQTETTLFEGSKEIQMNGDSISLLTWPWGHYRLPMVLLVVPR